MASFFFPFPFFFWLTHVSHDGMLGKGARCKPWNPETSLKLIKMIIIFFIFSFFLLK